MEEMNKLYCEIEKLEQEFDELKDKLNKTSKDLTRLHDLRFHIEYLKIQLSYQ